MPSIEIVYSRDGALYYVSHPFFRSSEWLSVAEHELPIPEDKKRGTFSGAVEIRKNDGRAYWRDAYPFAFYEIKSGRTEPLGEDTELFKDYASTSRWPETGTPQYAAEAERLIAHHRQQIESAQKNVDHHAAQIAALQSAASDATPRDQTP